MFCTITWTRLSSCILLLLTSLVFSCGFWDFNEPSVISVFPQADQSFISTNDVTNLTVLFSAKMNHFTVENSVQLKKINKAHFDEVTIAGVFSWSDNGLIQERLYFIPRNPLEYGKYRLDISQECEDAQGNNLSHETNIYFQIGSDLTAPVLVSLVPADGTTGVSNDQNISLTFDEPVDISSLPSLFSLDPGEQYYIVVSSNNTRFDLILLDTMSAGLHTLSISGVSDVYGNTQSEDINTYFTVGSDFIAPRFQGLFTNTANPPFVTNIINSMGKKQDLYFVFSEAMDIDTASVPVSFSPAIDGTWTLNSNILHFVPYESWEINRPYSISIQQGIQDLAGNETAAAVNYQVNISSPDSYFVKLLKIRYYTNILNPASINKIQMTNTNSSLSMDFFLQFNSPLRDYSVLENVSVSYISGSGELVSPYISTIMFSNTVTLKDTPILRIKDMSYFNLYKLTIKGGRDSINDTNDNWIKQDIEIYFRPEKI